tara:strand:+ start:589 stop:1569 length:981 start_codon:yes stop_codon:yes gene_type:complete
MNAKLISLSTISSLLSTSGIFYTFYAPEQNMENYLLSLSLFLTGIIIAQFITDNSYIQHGLKILSLIGIFILSQRYSAVNENNTGSLDLTIYDIFKIYAIIETFIALIGINEKIVTLIRTFFITGSIFYLLYEHVNFGDKLINSLCFINIAIILLTIIFVKVFKTNLFISLMVGSALFTLGIIFFTFQLTNEGLCDDINELSTSPMSGIGKKIMGHIILPLILLIVIFYESQWYCVDSNSNKQVFKSLFGNVKLLLITIIYIILMIGVLFLNIYFSLAKDKITLSEYLNKGIKNMVTDPYNFIIILCILFPVFSNFVSNNLSYLHK